MFRIDNYCNMLDLFLLIFLTKVKQQYEPPLLNSICKHSLASFLLLLSYVAIQNFKPMASICGIACFLVGTHKYRLSKRPVTPSGVSTALEPEFFYFSERREFARNS